MSNEEFGKLIKKLRQQKKMTQKELGEKLHITDKAISKWERGISFPDLEMINSIAEVFNVPVSTLIDTESKNTEKDTAASYKASIFKRKESKYFSNKERSLIPAKTNPSIFTSS